MRKETICCHITSYSLQLAVKDLPHRPRDRTTHTVAIVTPGVEQWLEQETDQWVYQEWSMQQSSEPQMDIHHLICVLSHTRAVSCLTLEPCPVPH